MTHFSTAAAIFPESKEPRMYRFMTYMAIHLTSGYPPLAPIHEIGTMHSNMRARNWSRHSLRRGGIQSCTSIRGWSSFLSGDTSTQ